MTVAAKHPGECAGDGCHRCWLAENDPRYQAKWGLPVTAAPRPATPLAAPAPARVALPLRPCAHRGPEQERVQCPTCAGHVEVKIFACAVHGRCSLAKPVPAAAVCQGCTDYAPAPDRPEAGQTRHLLFHLYPKRGERWRWHARELGRRLGLFNGRRILAIVTDEHSEDFATARSAFPGWDTYLDLRNDPALREVASFEPLFAQVAGLTGPGDVTLWAHSKGVIRTGNPAVARWVEAQYATLLDHWPAVAELLRAHPLAGSFRRDIQGWQASESRSDWHYSGSWFWFRNADLFARDWRRIDRFWSGIEAYPSLHFSREEAAVAVWSWAQGDAGGQSLYREDFWRGVLDAELARWKQAHADRRTLAGLLLPAARGGPLRIELGGGKFPRGGGFVNVDREHGDVLCDLEREPLPFADASVDELYSSHCLEHVANLRHVLREIVRVCRVGARVEIRVPAPFSAMAMCHDHKQVIADEQVDHWCNTAISYWLADSPRRLKHLSTERVPGAAFTEARGLFPHLTDDQVLRFIPGTCHEHVYRMEVVNRE